VNLVDPIMFQCRLSPGAPAICAPGTPFDLVSYGRLEQFICNAGRKASAVGLAPGQTVALFVADKILHAALILGLTRIGIVTLSGRNSPPPATLRVDVVLTDQRHAFLANLPVMAVDNSWITDGNAADDPVQARGGRGDVCRIVLTSGTTGEPKAVAMTHRLLQERIARYQFVKGNRFPGSRRVYCDLGLASSPGFRYMLYVLWRGGTIFFFGADADSTLDAFDRYDIQSMIASTHGLSEYLKFFEMADAYQCGFDHIIASGSMMSRTLSERVRARMCHHLYCSYGSTEASTVASAPAQAIADIPGAVGHVTPGVSIEIVDSSDKPLPAGEDGIVRIRSPFNVDGYVGSPGDSARAFRNGCFYPGDIGRLLPGRLLVISGRENSVLNLGGDKVKPELIEQVLSTFDGVDHAAVVSMEDELGIEQVWALLVARSPWNEEALRRHCLRHMPEDYLPARFVAVKDLPRVEGGKLDRSRLQQWARLGLN
jgi:acyl-CoA synthetase (AMP-forming)/AMP-acid ligase II